MTKIGRKIIPAMILFCCSSTVFAFSECVTDDDSRQICAHSGGTAINTASGVVCAPGKCIMDSAKKIKCSSESGGDAGRDHGVGIICDGECINPSAEYCLKPSQTKINEK